MEGKIYAHNQVQWEKVSQIKYFSEKQLEVIELENGIVLPSIETERKGKYKGGVCDSDFRFQAGFLRNGSDQTKDPLYYGLNMAYTVSKEKVKYCDEVVIFGGILVGHFGHFILESMGRLWYYIQNPDLPYKIVFTTVLEQKEWFWDFFRLLGIDESRICFIEQPTQFKKIIIPEESIHSWHSYTKEYLLPYETIVKKVKSHKYKKIYLTRTQFKESGAACCNEEYFEEFYKRKGFEIIAPEQYSIEEQISIVCGADEIVTTLGSISHFAMFCKKGARFTILTRVDDDVLPAQCLVNEASEVDWHIVDVSLNFLFATRVYGVNQIGITEHWKNYIKDTYGETIIEESIDKSCYEYIKKWCKFYSNPYQFVKIKNKEVFDVLSRMSQVLCGIKLEKNRFNVGKSKIELETELEKKDVQLKELERAKIEILRQQWQFQVLEEYIELISNARMNIFDCLKWYKNRKKYLNELNDVLLKEKERPALKYEIHVAQKGWLPRMIEGKENRSNTEKLQIEAMKIYFDDKRYHIFYSTLMSKGDWSNAATDGEMSGSTGKHIPLIGISVWLDAEMHKFYDVAYRLYNEKEGWSEWKQNGEKSIVSNNQAIELLQIKVSRKLSKNRLQ